MQAAIRTNKPTKEYNFQCEKVPIFKRDPSVPEKEVTVDKTSWSSGTFLSPGIGLTCSSLMLYFDVLHKLEDDDKEFDLSARQWWHAIGVHPLQEYGYWSYLPFLWGFATLLGLTLGTMMVPMSDLLRGGCRKVFLRTSYRSVGAWRTFFSKPTRAAH